MTRFGFGLIALALVTAVRAAEPSDPAELAARIDRRVEAHLKADGVKLAPEADDAEFLRRACLDVTGRIPSVADVHAFLADTSTDKRRRLIDRLLEEPRYAVHFANVWRAELAPEIATEQGASAFKVGFEAWLRSRLRAGTGYDELVRELLTVPIAAEGKDVEPVLRDPERANPLAFFAVKEARPENLAAAVTRTFLGIRLECAQCHDHPFARWKQDQFWSQAAFFAGVKRQGNGVFAPLTEARDRREVTPPGGRVALPAVFLDGGQPRWRDGDGPRAVLAEWVTAPDNPFFARASVNRLWGQFFGSGLVEPVDDFRDDNSPRDAELLDDLARSFAASRFDVRFLIRALTSTRAYGRTSALTDSTQEKSALPSRGPVKALSGEQFFDSLALATGYRDDQDRGAARRLFLSRFALTGSAGEPETSVQQALTLLNGRFVAWATDPEKCPTLIAVTKTPGLSPAQRVEALHLATLGRKPSTKDADRLARFVSDGPEPERLADLFWSLLNSAEFRLNH